MSAVEFDPAGEGEEPTAGEYVLGVLDRAARTAFAARLAAEPALRGEVAAWEARLSPLADAVAPIAPPPAVWTSVERALGPVASSADTASGVVIVLQRRLRAWRAASAVGFALAAALAVAVVLPAALRPPTPAPAAPPPMMMASLAPTAGGHAALFMATYDPVRHALMIAPAGGESHPGHAPELWLLPKGGKPMPLGMAGFGAPVRLEMAADMGAPGRTLLAVSLEPPGGSPTGAPTGPVIATGVMQGT